MSTDHIAKADALLSSTVNEFASDDVVDHHESYPDDGSRDYSYFLAAQVHATLAVAAELREANDIARRANELARANRGAPSGARRRRD
jgi:hypothetical protein